MSSVTGVNPSSEYNQLMSDVSANGTSASTIQSDTSNLMSAMQASGGNFSNLTPALMNMQNSLSNGTFSQQGSQGALEGAAARDGMTGVLAPEISGSSGLSAQDHGNYDGGSAFHSPQNGGHGDLAANADVLMDEMKGGAPTSQIKNNAEALKTEASNSGNSSLATAAQNIINSQSDGTYNADASANAISTAFGTQPPKT